LAGRTAKCVCGGRIVVPLGPAPSEPVAKTMDSPPQVTGTTGAGAQGPYHPSGRVRWARFVPAAAGALAAACVVALILAAMRRGGLYVPALAGLFVGVAAAAGAGGVIYWGHCRHRILGVTLGTALGLVGYLGQFQFEMAMDGGALDLVRVDRLPGRILSHIQNDAIVPQHGNPRRQPVTPVPLANALILLVEMIVAPLFGAYAGWTLAGRVYDEAGGRWAVRRWVLVAKGQAKELKRAAQAGTLAAALARLPPADAAHGKKVTVLVLDTVPPSPESPSAALYLTVGEVTLTVPMSWVERIIHFMPAALRQRRLSQQEAAAIQHWFAD